MISKLGKSPYLWIGLIIVLSVFLIIVEVRTLCGEKHEAETEESTTDISTAQAAADKDVKTNETDESSGNVVREEKLEGDPDLTGQVKDSVRQEPEQDEEQQARLVMGKESIFQEQVDAYLHAAANPEDEKTIASLGEQLNNTDSKDAVTLNNTAWSILTDGSVKVRDTKLALKLSKKAYGISDGKDAELTDTYALALYKNGYIKEAVEYEKKAVELIPDGTRKQQMTESLQVYQSAAKP